MDFEIYFNDLKEEAQQQLLQAAGIKDPADANWDIFPITVVGTETMLHDKAEEIMQDYLDGDDAEEMISQLRSLHTEGIVTDCLYDYIIKNWDELLGIKEES